ncbi:MAG: hypothetical protein PHI90_01425 [Clostridia bacterium]|nr:hypothetical protein [Clostridia bacterium]MDD4047486.1 hypothetical protein [Clostridia bacterium]
MLEEQANVDYGCVPGCGGNSLVWILFIGLLIICICPYIFRSSGPCPY